MPEASLDIPRTWAEFADPADAGQRFRVDLTWLTSSWTCIFGSGCKGIYADRPDDGCCTLGAHFTDDDDLERVRAVVAELGEDEWEHHPGHGRNGDKDPARRRRGPRSTRTATARPRSSTARASSSTGRGSPPGPGAPCTSTPCSPGRRRTRPKPDVCWQLPIRRSYRTVERARRHLLPRGDDRRVHPPRLGTGRARPRLVLLVEPRGARRARSRSTAAAAPSSSHSWVRPRTRSSCVRCEAHLAMVRPRPLRRGPQAHPPPRPPGHRGGGHDRRAAREGQAAPGDDRAARCGRRGRGERAGAPGAPAPLSPHG